ncbi:amidase [Sporormia fimetaria CBS 119925]|uniref:Amidase n=1 Tax=Sporormia fimetaria CBS 119925 TaxID=1340428 RepID=A0A6A6VMM2_9PLEO|nr:amidase [Sporormia fimetaria CBS 119925]
MTAPSDAPQWLQTALTKRATRDEAMMRFMQTGNVRNNREWKFPWPDHALSELQLTGETASEVSVAATTELDSTDQISQALLQGAVTATGLCVAYIRRLTEVLFDDALKQAQYLDRFFKEKGRLVGPLHGVPMTLKDQFDVEGYDSTLGYVGRAFKPAAQDSALATLLKRLGAVVIAKSNLPQSIMWCETENPLWGLTTHPKNSDFTPGGSTGGEGTLLALKGSVVGWGTDIGGSIRIPSHMLGLYGLKPSNTRLPYLGVAVSTEGQEHVPSVIGPMARNLDSLIAATKAVIGAKPWDLDPRCSPLPWRSGMLIEIQTRPLVIGIMRDDGVVKPHPPVARILEKTARLLEEAGHELVSWEPGTAHQECISIMDQFYTADGGEDIRRDVEAGGEPFLPHVEALVNKGSPISVYSYWQLNKQKLEAQKKFLDKWNSTVSPTTGKPIDILLTPVMPHSAVPHRKCRWVGYTKIFNFVDYPAVVLPAGEVYRELDVSAASEIAAHGARNELDSWNKELFDLETMHGMPIGVQLVARRLEEEKVLGAAKIVDELLRSAGKMA